MTGLGLEDDSKDVIVLFDGTVLETHGSARCAGEFCCVHNPSDHPLRDAPLMWLREAYLMLRVCRHDKAHPDPDSAEFLRNRVPGYDGWHPCCVERCCEPS